MAQDNKTNKPNDHRGISTEDHSSVRHESNNEGVRKSSNTVSQTLAAVKKPAPVDGNKEKK